MIKYLFIRFKIVKQSLGNAFVNLSHCINVKLTVSFAPHAIGDGRGRIFRFNCWQAIN